MGKLSILKEFWQFLLERKKWWLVPIFLVAIILGGVAIFSQQSVVAPFIYTIF